MDVRPNLVAQYKHHLHGFVTARNLAVTINQDGCPDGDTDKGERQ